MVATMDDLVDTLHRKVERSCQRLQGFTGSMARADQGIALLCTERFFKRCGVEVKES
jgi:hypothetical protein